MRISKIKNLEDDIALSLSALGIRIIAPIPGKGTIGIEVPNKNSTIVSMHSVISSQKFQQSEMILPIALGKTISNETLVVDLAKMPHLLMAGATGQGKSVGLNAVLTSLLYKKHPAEVKFVLVDPKKVELTLFNKIERHYLVKLPDSEEAIITDNTKVINTLNSLCIEMDNRYDLLKNAQCRNIVEYNKKFKSRKLNPNDGHQFLPYIVLVVDEFADLVDDGKVISFEPDRRYFQLLSKNADPCSILYNGAIADEVGEMVLSETGHLGGSTLLETEEVTNTYTVKTYTLDYLFETGVITKIDFLKMDIEGAEHHAFLGISDENLLKVRNVAMEYHHNLLGHNVELRESLIQRMTRLGFSNYTLYMGANENLQMLYFERKVLSNRKTNVHFVDGPFVEVNEDAEHQYNVQFIDGDTGSIVYETNIKSNHWTKASKKYYVNWIVKIKGVDNDFYREEKFNAEGQRIMICFESKSLGDSLAWIPYVEKFRTDNKCKVICSSFNNDLFKDQYPDIEFVLPGSNVNNINALYRLGLFYKNLAL